MYWHVTVRAQLLLAREIGYLGEMEAEMLVNICEEVSRLLRALRVRMK